MTLNRKGHLSGKWIIATSLSPTGNLDSLTATQITRTALQWGLKSTLVCGMMITVLNCIYTSAKNQPMVCLGESS